MSEFDFEAEVEGLGYLVLVPSWCQSSGEFLPRMIEKLKAKKLETVGTSHGGLVKLWLIDEGAAAEEGSSTFDLKVLNGDRQGIQRLLLKYSVLETPCIILPEHNKVVTFRELCANDNVSVSGEALPLQYSSSFGDGGALAEGADNKEVFDRAMDAYNEFDFTRACNLFSLITACTPPLPVVGEGEGEGELDTTAASRYNSSLFNLAGLFHMMELPSLSLLPSVRLLKRDPSDMISHTFLWGICQSALATIQKAETEEKEGREGREGRKLLECCVCSYNILCDATDDITARHRLATLGRPYVRNTNGTDREDATTEKNREREMLQAYARKIYDDMADKFESRLVEKLGYRGPWILLQMVQSAMENGPDSGRLSGATSDIEIGPLMGSWNILDVGCGSGLVGKVFRAFVDSDISSDTRSDTSASASAGAGAEEAIVSSLPSLSLSEGKDSIEAGDYSPLDFALQDMRDMRDMKDMKWSTKGSSKGKGVKGTRGIKRGCMVGVDISSKMTEITARTGHYHYTACGDAVDSIRAFVPPKNLLKSEESGDSGVSGVSCPVLCLDMVVAADTFIYLGPLAPVFCAARAALKGGGLLVFSVEDLDSSPMRISSIKAASTVASTASMLGKGKAAAAGTGTGTFTSTSTDTLEDSSSKDKDKDKDIDKDKDKESFLVEAAEEVEVDEPLAEHCQLLSSSRYAHSEAYISLMCGKFGFRVEQQMKVVLRTESTATPPELYGLMYVVRKEGK